MEASLGRDALPFIQPLPAPGKFQVDLKRINARWLERAGIDPGRIALCSACTACRRDEFWSHRLQGGQRGSMAAMIQLHIEETT